MKLASTRARGLVLPALVALALLAPRPETTPPTDFHELHGAAFLRPCELPFLLRIAFPDFQYPNLGARIYSAWVVLGCR